jgi:prepilin-type N-terminal cleavage/methylation domain-containing protein
MKKGFTLIELICCISIIAIISSIALYIPAKKMLQNSKFKIASNELLLDLKNAKMRAVDHGWIKVRFDDDGYMIYDVSNYSDMVIKKCQV